MLTVVLGYGKLISEYVYLLLTKLQFHRQHPDFNGKSGDRVITTGSKLLTVDRKV